MRRSVRVLQELPLEALLSALERVVSVRGTHALQEGAPHLETNNIGKRDWYTGHLWTHAFDNSYFFNMWKPFHITQGRLRARRNDTARACRHATRGRYPEDSDLPEDCDL